MVTVYVVFSSSPDGTNSHTSYLPPRCSAMPKSKLEQKITLSRTGKKGRDRKQAIIEEVRECVDKYKSLYVFTATNMCV